MEKNTVILISIVSILLITLIIIMIVRNGNNKQVTEISPQSIAPFSNGSTGTKRAFLIGCNYPGTNSELYGCIQDVKHIKSLLISLGYVESNILMLVDDGSTATPTKTNIKNNLSSFVNSTQENDVLFVWFSGHGTQLRNPSSDGGFDECWCPPDTLQSGNYLTDNELYAILSLGKSGSNIFVGSDSCHSATVLDLKYIGQQNQSTANRSLDEIRGKVSISDNCFAPLASNLDSDRSYKSQTFEKGNTLTILADSSFQETAANIVCISGCQDYDTSADAYLNGKSQGAMTWAFNQCFNQNMTLSDLLVNMRNLLSANRFPQIPQLTFGKILDPNTTTLFSLIG